MSGAATGEPGRQSLLDWDDGSRCSPTRSIKILPLASGQPSLIISVELPPELSSPLRDEEPTVSRPRARPACSKVPGADTEDNAGDRSYLVLGRPRVIMNDIRLRGLGVEGSDAAGRKTPDNQPGHPGLRWHQNEIRGDGRG